MVLGRVITKKNLGVKRGLWVVTGQTQKDITGLRDQLANHLHPFHTFQSRSIHVLKEYVLPPWIIEVFEFQRSYSSLRS